MNVKDFSYLLQNPDKVVSAEQSKQLESVIKEYPYFQAARALHLKGLKNNNSFKYNGALKTAAAHTADRDVLFDYITSKEFLQNSIADSISGRLNLLNEKETKAEKASAAIKKPVDLIEESEDRPLPRTLKDADHILDPELFESRNPVSTEESDVEVGQHISNDLILGEPLPFTKNEKHSFGEWLQLTSFKPIIREPKESVDPKRKVISKDISDDGEVIRKERFERIDKFLEVNPKIVPNENSKTEVNIKDSISFDKNELMTETLAKVYLEQKKYKKAIQAYKILSLKYPEKSGFFADRIKAVEKIQKENI